MNRTELQFAMDGAAERSMEEALSMVREVADKIDILEAGTSFILRYGMDAVRRFKAANPDKKILADMKIMDGGYHHAAMGCRFGADIITVLGVSDPETIRNAARAAHEYGKEIMVDLICVKNRDEVIGLCEEIGVDYICVHAGVDVQEIGADPYEDLKQLMGKVKTCKTAVAGGINADTVDEICRLDPNVMIVGGAIHKSRDPVQAAAVIRACIDRKNEGVLQNG